VAPILVYSRFADFGLDYARPVAVLVILISLLVFIFFRTIALRGKRA
jgi:molybdate/tungstate transport system permease protein